MPIEQLTENIYVNVDYDGGNIACVNTDEGLVLLDTPMLPQHIDEWKTFITSLNPKGVKYLINSHIHFDHILGNNQLGGVVISHEIMRERIFEKGATLREDMAGGIPGRSEAETSFILNETLISAEIVFSEELTIHLGGLTFQLVHIGGHTADSIVVYVPEEQILFAGDNITAASHPYKGDACFSDWLKGLDRLKDFEIKKIIPGHGEICERNEIDRFIDYFQTLIQAAEELINKGLNRDEVVKSIHDKMFSYFKVEPDMIEGSKMMFDFGTRKLYDELTADK